MKTAIAAGKGGDFVVISKIITDSKLRQKVMAIAAISEISESAKIGIHG